MNCPGCGRFMRLKFATEIGCDSLESAYWWQCQNEFCWHEAEPIAATEYDWLWWADGIPQAALEADVELRAAYNELLARYQERKGHHGS